MHTTKDPTAGLRMAALRPGSETPVHQRRLGKVYRFILNYEPQNTTTSEDESGEESSHEDRIEPSIG